MTIFEAILLGLIQGLTEFLPISSTAHLTLAGKILGLIDPLHPEDWTAFIAIIQLGTVAAVLLYFLRDLKKILVSLLEDFRKNGISIRGEWSHDSRVAFQIVIGTLPVVIIGLAFKKVIEGTFTKELSTMGTSLIVLALILLWAERVSKRIKTLEQTTWLDGLIIGIAQACALIPGSSRSGTTITAGLFLGLTRDTAARFSFLLSIPAVVASGLYELYRARHHLGDMGVTQMIVATIVGGVTGYAAIAFLLRYLRQHSTYLFIAYRLVIGIIIWMLILGGMQ